jgi:prophage maintenance system killer protein
VASSRTRISSRWQRPTHSNIAQNQPFVDGNKRTGLLAALVFLEFSGIAIADRDP